jgi:hypothetical protein
METTGTSKLSAQLLTVWRADAQTQAKADDQKSSAARPEETEQTAPLSAAIEPLPRRRIEIDAESGRFVHSLLDPQTLDVLLRYPSEDELAFSRGIRAYLVAQRESLRAKS